MAKRKSEAVEITAESLQIDVPAAEGVLTGGFLPADGTDELPAVVEAETEAETTWVERAEAVRAAANAKPDDDAPVPEHASIGNWEAVYWKSRPMWRHKRTGQTLFKRSEVWRLRNLK